MTKKIHLFMDSGAPTLYNTLARIQKYDNKKTAISFMGSFLKDRIHDNYDWLERPEYLEYKERYADYLIANKHKLEVYTNLDIVNNPKETWKNQKWLEKKGLNPLPVWHFGSDIGWLEHYIKKGYTYVGIGGMVPNPYTTLKPAMDEIFTKVLCDKRGYPIVKTHGFAASSARLMCRYPWYSVDSASWIKFAAFGGIFVPKEVKGKINFTERPHKLNLSIRSPQQKMKNQHITTLTPSMQRYVKNYIAACGFPFGKSRFVEKNGVQVEQIVERGICNMPQLRCYLNAIYYSGLVSQIPKWPWAFTPNSLHVFNL